MAMQTPSNSVNQTLKLGSPIRQPDPVYTPDASKAEGYRFEGFVISENLMQQQRNGIAISEAAAMCSIQDQILWLTRKCGELEAEKNLHLLLIRNLQTRCDESDKKVHGLAELECKDMTTMAASLKAHGELIGSILEERAKAAAITKTGVERAMSKRGKKAKR